MDEAWATPEAAEKAFYAAFEGGDLMAMMQVWADTPEVCCIHPMGKALRGLAAVREGWAGIFSSGLRLHFVLEPLQWQPTDDLAISVVLERIQVAGEKKPRPPMVATNVYRRTALGWRMVLHHASPAVVEVAKDMPQRLH
jgi:ketosteroid isomerase-like protein